MVLVPDCSLEPLAAGIADGHIREEIVVVVGSEGLGEKAPEGVVGAGGEDVVAQGPPTAVGDPDGVIEEWLEVGGAALGGKKDELVSQTEKEG